MWGWVTGEAVGTALWGDVWGWGCRDGPGGVRGFGVVGYRVGPKGLVGCRDGSKGIQGWACGL